MKGAQLAGREADRKQAYLGRDGLEAFSGTSGDDISSNADSDEDNNIGDGNVQNSLLLTKTGERSVQFLQTAVNTVLNAQDISVRAVDGPVVISEGFNMLREVLEKIGGEPARDAERLLEMFQEDVGALYTRLKAASAEARRGWVRGVMAYFIGGVAVVLASLGMLRALLGAISRVRGAPCGGAAARRLLRLDGPTLAPKGQRVLWLVALCLAVGLLWGAAMAWRRRAPRTDQRRLRELLAIFDAVILPKVRLLGPTTQP